MQPPTSQRAAQAAKAASRMQRFSIEELRSQEAAAVAMWGDRKSNSWLQQVRAAQAAK